MSRAPWMTRTISIPSSCRLVEDQVLLESLRSARRVIPLGGGWPRPPLADAGHAGDLAEGGAGGVIESQGGFQAGLRRQIGGLVVQIPVAAGGRDIARSLRWLALLSRSVRRRFFSSQYSGVTAIGWPESSPSSRRASMRSSAFVSGRPGSARGHIR